MLQRGDQLLLDLHSGLYVSRRVLVVTPQETWYDERDLRKPAVLQIGQVIRHAAAGPDIVGPALPEDEHVVAVARRNRVPGSVVDLPRDAGGLEQVKDDWVVKDPESPLVVVRDASGRPRHQVEPVRVRGSQHRAEVVRAQREVAEQAVVERQIL